MLLLSISAATLEAGPDTSCAREVRATAAVYRIADLPPSIRSDLLALARNSIGDPGSPLLNTDAPGPREAQFPRMRFYQAIRVRTEWFVQFEVAMLGMRTIGYIPDAEGFHRFPLHYFGGSPCDTIKAILRGVTSPGGFNFE